MLTWTRMMTNVIMSNDDENCEQVHPGDGGLKQVGGFIKNSLWNVKIIQKIVYFLTWTSFLFPFMSDISLSGCDAFFFHSFELDEGLTGHFSCFQIDNLLIQCRGKLHDYCTWSGPSFTQQGRHATVWLQDFTWHLTPSSSHYSWQQG